MTGSRPGGRTGYGGVNNRGAESDTDYEEVSKRPSYPNTGIYHDTLQFDRILFFLLNSLLMIMNE